MIRWYLDLAFVKTRCVGKVYQLPSTEDAVKGGIKQESPWQAYGMKDDWQDTDLGHEHRSREDARKAVADWWGKQ